MRASTGKGLGMLEQARFVVDLLTIHGTGVAEVMARCHDARLASRAFWAQADLLCGGLLRT